MEWRNSLNPDLPKVLWTIVLVGFAFKFGYEIEIASILVVLANILAPSLTNIAQKAAQALLWPITLLFYYGVACVLIYLYDQKSIQYPNLRKFFGLTRRKQSIILVLLISHLTIWSLSRSITFFPLQIVDMFLGGGDVGFLLYLLDGRFVAALGTFAWSLSWWYLISCAIDWFKK